MGLPNVDEQHPGDYVDHHLAWCAVLAMVGGAALVALQAHPRPGAPIFGPWVSVVLGAIGAYVALGLLWGIDGVARTDARFVALLTEERKSGMAAVFGVLTLGGEAITTTLVATGVAVVLHARTGAWQVWLTLPWVIAVEEAAQALSVHYLPAVGLDSLDHGLVDGVSGGYPSGSVARLIAVFGIAALLTDRLGLRGGLALRATGAVLVLEQATSRLYLGRHLMADVAGGLLLGFVLVAAAGVVIRRFLPQHVDDRTVVRPSGVGAG